MLNTLYWIMFTGVTLAGLVVATILFGWWLPALVIVGGVLDAWHQARKKARARQVSRLMSLRP